MQLYDKRGSRSLTTLSFWKTGVLLAALHGAVCFFIPYYSLATSGKHNITDVYSLGKLAFVALLGAVTLEVALVARYWTWLFGVITVLSYALVYPFMLIFPLAGAVGWVWWVLQVHGSQVTASLSKGLSELAVAEVMLLTPQHLAPP